MSLSHYLVVLGWNREAHALDDKILQKIFEPRNWNCISTVAAMCSLGFALNLCVGERETNPNGQISQAYLDSAVKLSEHLDRKGTESQREFVLEQKPKLLSLQAMHYLASQKPHLAEQTAVAALDALRNIDDERSKPSVLIDVGDVRQAIQPSSALYAYSEAVRLAESSGDTVYLGIALQRYGTCLVLCNRTSEAIPLLIRGTTLFTHLAQDNPDDFSLGTNLLAVATQLSFALIRDARSRQCVMFRRGCGQCG